MSIIKKLHQKVNKYVLTTALGLAIGLNSCMTKEEKQIVDEYRREFSISNPSEYVDEKIAVLDSKLNKATAQFKDVQKAYLDTKSGLQTKLKKYPDYTPVSNVEGLSELIDYSMTKITAEPAVINSMLEGKLSLDVSLRGGYKSDKLGGLSVRGKAVGDQALNSKVDGTYWSTFVDSRGEAFVVVPADLPKLILDTARIYSTASENALTTISEIDKEQASFKDLSNLVSHLSLWDWDIDLVEKFDQFTYIRTSIEKYYRYVDLKNQDVPEDIQKSDTVYEAVLSHLKASELNRNGMTEEIKQMYTSLENTVIQSFKEDTDAKTRFKLQVESNAQTDAGLKYTLTGVKTTVAGIPTLHVIGYTITFADGTKNASMFYTPLEK